MCALYKNINNFYFQNIFLSFLVIIYKYLFEILKYKNTCI